MNEIIQGKPVALKRERERNGGRQREKEREGGNNLFSPFFEDLLKYS